MTDVKAQAEQLLKQRAKIWLIDADNGMALERAFAIELVRDLLALLDAQDQSNKERLLWALRTLTTPIDVVLVFEQAAWVAVGRQQYDAAQDGDRQPVGAESVHCGQAVLRGFQSGAVDEAATLKWADDWLRTAAHDRTRNGPRQSHLADEMIGCLMQIISVYKAKLEEALLDAQDHQKQKEHAE